MLASKRTGMALLGTSALLSIGYLLWKFLFSKRRTPAILDISVIDIAVLERRDEDPEAYERECKKVADALYSTGLLVVKNSGVTDAENNRFLDNMERYFEQSDGTKDARPEHSFQVGVTPSHKEKALNHCERMNKLTDGNEAISPCPPEFDPKWRFFWRIGDRPTDTKYGSLNMEQVVPEGFDEWEDIMNGWGHKMLSAVEKVAAMAAHGVGLEDDALTSRMHLAPHLLAPTGSDFNTYTALDTPLAGYHYDFNLFTIHSKSRFPGLYAWARDGTKQKVVVPDGCLLVQAGKQMEYLTGGHVLAGFHEVVITPDTQAAIERTKQKYPGRREKLWRVSSTLFSHVASDITLRPIGKFATEEAMRNYPPRPCGEWVQEELNSIALGVDSTEEYKEN
jgi:isopenicillin N synthase-like dioxygenase